MKNLVLITLVLIGITFFSSCDNQELDLTTVGIENNLDLPFVVSNENGVLNFETKVDYELALDYLVELDTKGELEQFEKQLGFNSYRSTYQFDEQKMNDIQDDILATFLNPSNKVIIEQKMFEVNLVEDRVLVWEHQDCELKSAKDEMLIGEFRCDDDVFDKLEGGTLSKSVNATTCPSTKYGVTGRSEMVDQGQYLAYYDYYIQYIKGGIYYTLNARMRCQLTKTVLKIECNGGTYRQIREDTYGTIEEHEESGKNWERNYRGYWGLKRLESYNFPVTFSTSTTTTIKKDGIDAGVTEDIFTELVTGICDDE